MFTQCIGTVFAEAQWSGGVFPLPLYLFKVSHVLYYRKVPACSFPAKVAFELTQAMLRDAKIVMWVLVSQQEKANENALQKASVLKFYLGIIKTRGQ